jgi:hypothetical protein
MPQSDLKPPRPWQEIAKAASKEANSDKLSELVAELVRALDPERTKPVQPIRTVEKDDKKHAA